MSEKITVFKKNKKRLHFLKKSLKGERKEFTKGNINKAVLILAIPMILEMIMESIFSLVDLYFVSKISINAVSTIGLTESVITIIYAISTGLSIAATSIIARRIGEKEVKKANEVAVQVIIIGVLVSFIISIVGMSYSKEILYLMGGDSQLIKEGYTYTKIMLGGNITIVLLFIINAIYRGVGSAYIAMWALIFSNLLNIILDPILIFGFGPIPAYGIEGAAIATNIGRGFAVIFQFVLLFVGFDKIKISIREFIINSKLILKIIKVSLGSIGQFLVGTSSWIILMRIISEFGSEVLAGYIIAVRIIMFTLMPSWGMCNAVTTLVGQNLGANKPKRAEDAVWITGKYNFIYMLIITVILTFFSETIISQFNSNLVVIKNGVLCLNIFTASYVFYAYGLVFTNAFNGAGDTITPIKINLICFWLFQLPVAYVTSIVFKLGPIGVFIAITLSQILITFLSFYLFKKGKWKSVNI